MVKLRLEEQEVENEKLLRNLTEVRDSTGGDRSPLYSDRKYRSRSPGPRVNACRSQENVRPTAVSPKYESYSPDKLAVARDLKKNNENSEVKNLDEPLQHYHDHYYYSPDGNEANSDDRRVLRPSSVGFPKVDLKVSTDKANLVNDPYQSNNRKLEQIYDSNIQA